MHDINTSISRKMQNKKRRLEGQETPKRAASARKSRFGVRLTTNILALNVLLLIQTTHNQWKGKLSVNHPNLREFHTSERRGSQNRKLAAPISHKASWKVSTSGGRGNAMREMIKVGVGDRILPLRMRHVGVMHLKFLDTPPSKCRTDALEHEPTTDTPRLLQCTDFDWLPKLF